MKRLELKQFELWIKGVVAAAISGAAGGILTGFAAVGIDPQHFNLQAGAGATLRIAAAAALINAVIGVAAYLQKSPLPDDQARG
jgi:Zn-dependent protease